MVAKDEDGSTGVLSISTTAGGLSSERKQPWKAFFQQTKPKDGSSDMVKIADSDGSSSGGTSTSCSACGNTTCSCTRVPTFLAA
jgi:hypothetical protein